MKATWAYAETSPCPTPCQYILYLTPLLRRHAAQGRRRNGCSFKRTAGRSGNQPEAAVGLEAQRGAFARLEPHGPVRDAGDFGPLSWGLRRSAARGSTDTRGGQGIGFTFGRNSKSLGLVYSTIQRHGRLGHRVRDSTGQHLGLYGLVHHLLI